MDQPAEEVVLEDDLLDKAEEVAYNMGGPGFLCCSAICVSAMRVLLT
jgi:hypothetical protein